MQLYGDRKTEVALGRHVAISFASRTSNITYGHHEDQPTLRTSPLDTPYQVEKEISDCNIETRFENHDRL